MNDGLNFSGKRILITGAARGIGLATACLLDKFGANLVLADIDGDGLKGALSKLNGEGHSCITFDFNDLDNIEAIVKKMMIGGAPISGFVHCVGIRSRRPIAMIKPGVLQEVLRVNLGSFIELIRCICKKGNYEPPLNIVGVSSISSQKGGAGITAYAASKAAMDGAVRCLAKELAPKKIRLNTVVPAQINTPAYEELLQQIGDKKDATTERQYLGLGEPTDVANVIVFLLSENARFITGSAIPVDGGFLSS